MTGIISPEETMEHAQQAAQDLRNGDVEHTTCAEFCMASGQIDFNNTTAMHGVNADAVMAAIKVEPPTLG